jgi:hypothetical protein
MKRFIREFKRINWPQTLFGSFKRSVITLLIVIPAVSYGVSFGYQYYLSQNPAAFYAHKVETLTQAVSKSLILPSDEIPETATVTDKNILPKEKFFSYAQDGDKILMYKKHKIAILFRPSTGKVITEAVLDFNDVTPTPLKGPGSSAVAGASTSAFISGVSALSPTPVTAVTHQSSGTTTYHPQGKILVAPQQ